MTIQEELKNLRNENARLIERNAKLVEKNDWMTHNMKILYDKKFHEVPKIGGYIMTHRLLTAERKLRPYASESIQEIMNNTTSPLVWAMAKDLEELLMAPPST